MHQIKVSFSSRTSQTESVLRTIQDLGVPAHRLVQTVCGKEREVCLYEESMRTAQGLARGLRRKYPHARVSVEKLKAEDWLDDWQAGKKIKRLSSRFWCASDKKAAAGFNQAGFLIELPVLSSFGSGEHPSTRIAVSLLEKAVCRGKTMLDAGCGCGILSAAAAKLDAARILALDISPSAVRDARCALKRNGCTVATVRKMDIRALGKRQSADIVAANLPETVLVKHRARLMRLVLPGGYLLISGLHKSAAVFFNSICLKNDFRCVRKICLQGWCGALFKRKAL